MNHATNINGGKVYSCIAFSHNSEESFITQLGRCLQQPRLYMHEISHLHDDIQHYNIFVKNTVSNFIVMPNCTSTTSLIFRNFLNYIFSEYTHGHYLAVSF